MTTSAESQTAAINSAFPAEFPRRHARTAELLLPNQDLFGAIVSAIHASEEVTRSEADQTNEYTYATAEDIFREARGALAGHGVVAITVGYDIRPGIGHRQWLIRDMILAHAPTGQQLRVKSAPWPLVQSSDRSMGQTLAAALTSGLRYFLRDLLLIPQCEPGESVHRDIKPDTVLLDVEEPDQVRALSEAIALLDKDPSPEAQTRYDACETAEDLDEFGRWMRERLIGPFPEGDAGSTSALSQPEPQAGGPKAVEDGEGRLSDPEPEPAEALPSLEDLDLSVRARWVFDDIGIASVEQLVTRSAEELRATKVARVTVNEIQGKLAEHGLSLRANSVETPAGEPGGEAEGRAPVDAVDPEGRASGHARGAGTEPARKAKRSPGSPPDEENDWDEFDDLQLAEDAKAAKRAEKDLGF